MKSNLLGLFLLQPSQLLPGQKQAFPNNTIDVLLLKTSKAGFFLSGSAHFWSGWGQGAVAPVKNVYANNTLQAQHFTR